MSPTITRNDLSDEFESGLSGTSVVGSEFAVSGVVKALVAEFGANVRIYKEEAPEGYEAPAFFVYEVDGHRNKLHGNNYQHLYSMQVRYELEDGNLTVQQALRAIATALYSCLEAVTFPNFDGYDENGNVVETNRPIRPKGMTHHTEDGVLFFDFTLDLHLVKPYKVLDKMETLSLTINEAP